MSTVILLLALFGVKHFICDFLLQFPYMIREKGTYGAEGGLHHAGLHAAFTLLICVFFAQNGHDAVTVAAIDGLVHYHIDWVKQRLNRGLTAADRMFWVWLGADQGLHYLTYVGIIGYLVSV
jgi:hypothetical protein